MASQPPVDPHALLTGLNELITANEPAKRSKLREVFDKTLQGLCDFGASNLGLLDGVPVIDTWLPLVKAVFWLGVVYCHRRDAGDACKEFADLLRDSYGVAFGLGLGRDGYSFRILNDVALALIAFAEKRQLKNQLEGGVRKVWYETRHAFARENIIGYIRHLSDTLVFRYTILGSMLAEVQHDLAAIKRANIPLDPPPAPPHPFIGRTDDIRLVEGIFRNKPIVLHGLVGIGKTSFARQTIQDVYTDQRQVVVSCRLLDSVAELTNELLRVRPERLRLDEVAETALKAALRKPATVIVLDDLDLLWKKAPVAVERLVLVLASLSSVTLVLTTVESALYDELQDPAMVALALDPFSLAERRQLFTDIAPQYAGDQHLDDLLYMIGGQPLVVRSVAVRARTGRSPLELMIHEWSMNERQDSGHASDVAKSTLPTVVMMSLRRLRSVPDASSLLALLLRLPYGMDVGRLAAGFYGSAIRAVVDLVGLGYFGSPTLHLFQPFADIVQEEDFQHAGALSLDLPLDLVDALLLSFIDELQARLAKCTPRRLDVPVSAPTSPDWANLPYLVEIAIEVRSKHLGSLATVFETLVTTLPLPGELSSFLRLSDRELSRQLEKVRLVLLVDAPRSPLDALWRDMVAVLGPSRRLDVLRQSRLGSTLAAVYDATPFKRIEVKALATSPVERLLILVQYQLAKLSGIDTELDQASTALATLSSPSLLGWSRFDCSATALHELLKPKPPSTLEAIYSEQQLYFDDMQGEIGLPRVQRVSGSAIDEELALKHLGQIFEPLDEAIDLARAAADPFLLAYALTRYAGLSILCHRRFGPKQGIHAHQGFNSAEEASEIYAEQSDTAGLVMLLKYMQRCSFAGSMGETSRGTADFEKRQSQLQHEILDALRILEPSQDVLRAALDTLGLDREREARLLASAPRPPRRKAQQQVPPAPSSLFSVQGIVNVLGLTGIRERLVGGAQAE